MEIIGEQIFFCKTLQNESFGTHTENCKEKRRGYACMVYFQLRGGKKDIKAASELTINPNHWSVEKQRCKNHAALGSEDEKTVYRINFRYLRNHALPYNFAAELKT